MLTRYRNTGYVSESLIIEARTVGKSSAQAERKKCFNYISGRAKRQLEGGGGKVEEEGEEERDCFNSPLALCDGEKRCCSVMDVVVVM